METRAIGGDFTSLSPNGGAAATRNHVARLNPDGTLDTSFDPNANGAVDAIVVQPDGQILVGGEFNGAASIAGQTRNYIARLNGVSGLADVSFNPNANDLDSHSSWPRIYFIQLEAGFSVERLARN